MALFVRTGNGGLNSAVNIDDLGIRILPGTSFTELTYGSSGDPTSGAGQFTVYELYASKDLYSLIQSSALEASSDGTNHDIASGDYTTSFAINAASRIDFSSKIPQYVTVGLSGNVDFNSIKDAIDSITDSSIAKIYTVYVYPGVYLEDTIVMKSGINLVGIGNLVVVIAPRDPTQDLLIAADVTSIYGIIFNGATGFNTSSIRYTSESLNHSNTVLLQNCFFATNDRHITIAGGDTGTYTNVEMVGCRFGGLLSNFSIGIDISNLSGGQALLSMSGCNMFSADAAIPDSFIAADGYGTFVSMSGCDISTKQITPATGIGINITNGADVSTSSVILSGWNKAIWVENVGSGPALKAVAGNLFNNVVDLSVDHPAATGSFSGVLSFDKTFINSDSTFALSGGDSSTGSVIILNELRFGKSVATATDVGDLILSDPTLGVSAGGILSKGTGFTVNVAAGFGYVQIAPFPNTQLRKYTWNDSSILLSANSTSYIFVNQIGTLTAAASLPDTTQNIIFGRAITHNTGIDFIDQSKVNANHAPNFLDQAIRNMFGATHISGSIVTDAGARSLNVSSGTYYLSQHKYSPTGGSPISFTNYFQDGLGAFSRQLGQTQVNNTQYDNGSGTLATLADGYYTKHVLYISGDGYDESYLMVFGQAQYPSLGAADSALLPIPPVYFTDGVTPIASIIIQKSSSSISSVQDERNIRGNSPTALAAASDHGNLLGLLDDDHPQYLLVDGTRSMGGNLNLNGFSVTSVNLVDGVDVSSHASRHLPNGADSLATAAPVTIGAANAIGVANSLARSDHQHNHGSLGGGTTHAVATISSAGFLSTADKARLDILSQETTILAVRNETGVTINKGKLVAITGYNSLLGVLLIGLADKDVESLRPAVGITRTDIPNNTTDVVLVTGILSGVNTSSFLLTDQLVLGDAGAFTRPPPDNLAFTGEVQLVGSVARVGLTDGYVVVNVGQGLNPVSGDQVFALAGTDGYASATNKYVTNSDARNTNSRTPTGSATGQLSGSYPNPSVIAITESSGPTALTIGSIPDGYGTVRSGSTFIGRAFGSTTGTFADGYDSRFPTTGEKQALAGTFGLPSSSNKYITESDSRNTNSRAPTGSAGGNLSGTYPNPFVAALRESSGPTSLTLGSITDTQGLVRSGTTVIGKSFGSTTGTFADGYDSRFPTAGEKQALAGTFGLPSSANKYITEADSRNTNSRAPTGSASGQLGGTYPSPTVVALTESGGPTALTIGSISDGTFMNRVGSTLVGTSALNSQQNVSSTGTINTTSTTDVLATGMTITPGAGTYIVIFSGSVTAPNGGTATASIYANGSQVTATERATKGDTGLSSGTTTSSFTCLGVATVAAAQAIEGRWRTNTGTASMLHKILMIIKI